MEKEKARKILTLSITNLEKRNEGVTQGDIHAEIINNACLAIIRNQNEKIGKGSSFRDMLMGAINSTQDHKSIANAFIEAARELLPEYFDEDDEMIVIRGIEQNLEWGGIWKFLIGYFRENHGINIDKGETTPVLFFSTREEKYEDGILISDTEVNKTVSLNFSENFEELLVSIEKELPPQNAVLIAREENVLQYRNDNLNYTFTVTYDDYEEVETFRFEKDTEHTETIYFE